MEDSVWKAVQEQCPDVHQVDLLIALPSFNHASTIGSVLTALLTGLKGSFADASVLIINADVGSQDGTPEIVK
ncbi:MAG TPA: glycosyl transferase family 2, partial [Terriglobia bacterium]|nr:glycosyl transferase family 2 [Terriglobia bacterium]